MRIPLVVMAMVPAALLIGCIGESDPPSVATEATPMDVAPTVPVRVLEDAADDTVLVPGPGPVVGASAGACVYDAETCTWAYRWSGGVGVCGSAGCTVVAPDPAPLAAAFPAPAALDIVGVELSETPESVLVDLVLREAPAALDDLFGDDSVLAVSWTVEWGAGSGDCMDWVRVFAIPNGHGIFPAEPFLRVACQETEDDSPCKGLCFWQIPLEIEPGELGRMRFEVPRHVLPHGEAGAVFDAVRAATRVWTSGGQADAVPGPYAESWWRDFGYGWGNLYVDTGRLADEAVGDAAMELRLAPAAPPTGGPVWHADGEGDAVVKGEYRPDLDILAIGLADTAEALSVTWEVAEVRPDPPPGQLYMQFAVASGEVVRAASGRLDEPYFWADRYNATTGRSVPIEAELAIEEGRPGRVTVTLDRGDLGSPADNALLGGPMFWTTKWGDGVEVPNGGLPVWTAVDYESYFADYAQIPPFRFGHATASAVSDKAAVTFPDEAGDVAPPELLLADPGAFEITYVQTRPAGPDEVALALGIADATTIEPPAPFGSAVWVAAVETAHGAVMVAHMEPGDEDFCVEDTMAFSEARRVPDPAERREIVGRLERAQAGERNPGAFIWTVPRECFDAAGPPTIEASRVGASTHLVPRPQTGGDIETLDKASGDGPITLMSAPAAPARPRSWFTDAEWLLLAFGAALVVAEVGVFAIRHRRRGGPAEDRLLAYRRVLEREVRAQRPSKEIAHQLKPLRAALGISEREHARLEAETRTRLAATLGGGRSLVPGERFLDRYEVVERLPAGGGGRTYACRDVRLGRPVVLKVLSCAGEDIGPVLREARAFAAVRHESVVTLFDVENVGDDLFLVLEHVPGGSLKQRVARGPLSRDEVLRLGDDLLSALGAVHAAGIVHRDVKPANVLATGDGRYKLADFGIAHVAGRDATAAGFGTDGAAGTLRYMSPEQARGERVDARSDLFSAAATLYEAWTGTPYVEARREESVAEVQLRVAAGRGSLDAWRGPARLRAFFERALAGAPDRRFQDADAMRVALLDALRAVEGRDAAAMLHGPAE